MRGGQVSIKGDMQQVQQYTVAVETPEGFEGQGGVVYANIETTHGGTVNATQFFTVDQVEPIAVDGYDGKVTLNGRVITVTYTLGAEPCREISSLSELKNYKLYYIKNKLRSAFKCFTCSFVPRNIFYRMVLIESVCCLYDGGRR